MANEPAPMMIHIIYCSAARVKFTPQTLAELLRHARRNNAEQGVTGMLLYTDGSFFQVLEGEEKTVDALFASISRDQRHAGVSVIIREPIARRAFADWTMGLADMSAIEIDSVVGTNDVFTTGASFARLGPGRAKKLLAAFKQGRWRARLSDSAMPDAKETSVNPLAPLAYSFAFQPIIHAGDKAISSFEALIRGTANESAATVLKRVEPADEPRFHAGCLVAIIELAARLKLRTRVNINFPPSVLRSAPDALRGLLSAADRCQIDPGRIVLEILESEVISDPDAFAADVNEYRHSGLVLAIDDFGSGYAGLNLLSDFQPDLIKLDIHLVRGIESNGPRQAIVRGVLRTCQDLGIEILAEGVETTAEFDWLRKEGIELFQGYLFARPSFEQLPDAFHLPP
jgi:EAL domain-containing protein (putative c-di-GMP-specific phosphodiesterase class I)